MDIWDLLEKTHEPAQSQNICITMITYIKPWTFSCTCLLPAARRLWCSPEKPLPRRLTPHRSCGPFCPRLSSFPPAPFPRPSNSIPILLPNSGSPKASLLFGLSSSNFWTSGKVRPLPILNHRMESFYLVSSQPHGVVLKPCCFLAISFPEMLSCVSLSTF